MNIEIMRAMARTDGKVTEDTVESDSEEWLSCLEGILLETVDNADEGRALGDTADCPTREGGEDAPEGQDGDIPEIPWLVWTVGQGTPDVTPPPGANPEVEATHVAPVQIPTPRIHPEGTDRTDGGDGYHHPAVKQPGTAAAKAGRDPIAGEKASPSSDENPAPDTRSSGRAVPLGEWAYEASPVASESAIHRGDEAITGSDNPKGEGANAPRPDATSEWEVRSYAESAKDGDRADATVSRHAETDASTEVLPPATREVVGEVRGSFDTRGVRSSPVPSGESLGTRKPDDGMVTIRMDAEDSAPITVRLRAAGEQLVGHLRSPDPILVREMSAGARELERTLSDTGFERVDFEFEAGDPHRQGREQHHRWSKQRPVQKLTYPSISPPESVEPRGYDLRSGLDLLA